MGSIRRQYKLLSLNRSKEANNFDANEALMRKINEIYTNCPFYGYKRIKATLKRKGYLVNSKHVFRLMKQMGLMAIFPKPNLSCQKRIKNIRFSILAAGKGD